MEDEIDLRPYIEALVKHWYWIIGATILAGILTFVAISIIPPTYEATALVAVIPSADVIQFDARFREGPENQPLDAFPQLAVSDQVLQSLIFEEIVEASATVGEIRRKLEAETGGDASILKLTASSDNPQEAADLANGWAEIFVEWANNVYGEQSGEQVRFFEEQLAEAEVELNRAEEALIEFQAINRTQIISSTLASYNEEQLLLLESLNHSNDLKEDVQYLRDQLAAQPNGDSVSFAYQLTALSMLLQAFSAENAMPLQLQVDTAEPLTGATQSDQLTMLDNLLTTLSLQTSETSEKLTELEPQILDLQQKLQEASTRYRRLSRNKIVAEETYIALAHKVEEERISSADTTSGVRLASIATIPQQPSGPSKIVAVIIVSILVFFGYILWVVIFIWWQQYKNHEVK